MATSGRGSSVELRTITGRTVLSRLVSRGQRPIWAIGPASGSLNWMRSGLDSKGIISSTTFVLLTPSTRITEQKFFPCRQYSLLQSLTRKLATLLRYFQVPLWSMPGPLKHSLFRLPPIRPKVASSRVSTGLKWFIRRDNGGIAICGPPTRIVRSSRGWKSYD